MSLEPARQAELEGLIDIAYERHDSPLGSIVVAATHDCLVRIGLPIEDEDGVVDEVGQRISGRILPPRPAVSQARRQLDEYFQRRRTQFEVTLDWQLTGGFRRQVLAAMAEIPYGQTASYTDDRHCSAENRERGRSLAEALNALRKSAGRSTSLSAAAS